ncbi:hypothetical protein ACIRPP_23345 [Streptomyces sp. NPDC101219]|uniref:hypothetical protein n=1 Tax=Streptomyces sp. NPDC101219 TaxID=3366131 RepID=UPI003800F217
MATGTTESPATLYGPVSLFFGVVGLVLAFFLGFFGILAGALAVTFGVLGLVSKAGKRTQCALGLATGAVAVLFPLGFLFLYSGGL